MLDKCPEHPGASGESDYGGLWCKGPDGGRCKWARKDFVNELESGETETVRKWHLPEEGGRWRSEEDYLIATQEMAPGPPSTPSAASGNRERSIVRQTCIKAAARVLAPAVGAKEEIAGSVTYLAGVFEDWVNR